jgi:uncharacterized protein YbaP (TraB family)
MNKNYRKVLLLKVVALLFLSTLTSAQPSDSKALLWKVSGKGLKEPSFIFGTYHLLGDKFLSQVPETDAPFRNAKGVVVETVIDSSKLMSVAMMGIMRDNKISNLISAEDFKSVDSLLQKYSAFNLNALDMFKPAQVSAILVLLQSQKLNEEILTKYAGMPLDVHIAASAKKLGKPVTQLEGMEEQMKMLFDHFPVEEQARQLVEYVKKNDMIAKTHVEMLDLYIKKDLSGLQSIMESYPEEVTGNGDYLLKDRNVKWVKLLPAVMNSGSQFIAVGAGHLPGKDGLIALLKNEGYNVEPVVK